MAAFEAWLVFLILVVNVVGELQRKRTLAASRGFLAAARLSCFMIHPCDGRTDGRAIAYTRYSIYAVTRKNGRASAHCTLVRFEAHVAYK